MLLQEAIHAYNIKVTIESEVDDSLVASLKKLPSDYVDMIVERFEAKYGSSFIVNVFKKILIKNKLSKMVSKEAYVCGVALGISEPSELFVYIISLLDYYSEHKKPASKRDILNKLYPKGFYSYELCRYITNNDGLKNKLRHGFIFNK